MFSGLQSNKGNDLWVFLWKCEFIEAVEQKAIKRTI